MSEPTPTAENAAAPRRGRRARALTPEEQAEMDARREEFERQQALEAERREAALAVARGEDPGAEPAADEDADGDATAEVEEGDSVGTDADADASPEADDAPDTEHDVDADEHSVTQQPEHHETHEHHHRADVDPVGGDARDHAAPAARSAEAAGAEADAPDAWAAPSVPAEPVQPSVRRLGKRARVVELDPERTDPTSRVPDHRAAASETPGHGAPQTIPTDADGVELGEIPVGEHPDPRPAPRFEGRVLHRADRSGGNPVVWVVWAVVVLAIIALVVLLATGTLGGGSDSALAAFADAPALTTSTITAFEGALSA